MTLASPFGIYHVLLMAYVGSVLGLTLIAFLVALYFRRTQQQPAPRVPFILALALGGCFLAGYLLSGPTARTVQSYLLLGCAASCIYGSMSLYFTLRKEHK